MNLLVFTDLDGTLMEHESYSVEPARGALAALARLGVTPIINSSKTRPEITTIQNRLQLDAPFISENGAALYNYKASQGEKSAERSGVKSGESSGESIDKVFGLSRDSWLRELHQLREQMSFKFEGFSDWEPQQLAEITGLSRAEAELAKDREFSEPILWRDTAKAFAQFTATLEAMGLQLIEGGRFFSIQGKHDKATAMNWLRETTNDSSVTTIALGDSPNDSAMLEAADIAVIIKSGKSERIQLQKPDRIIRTSRPGPAGWHDAMMEILERPNAINQRGSNDG